MAGLISITFEGKKSVEEIQKRFKDNLSEKEILKTTARAINETAKKVQGHIRQNVRKHYTIKNKYLMKMSYISRMASNSSLFAHVKFSYKPVPMIAFQHTGTPNSNRRVTVTVKKGETITLRHAFIAAIKRQGEDKEQYGVYSHGRYIGRKFVYEGLSKRMSQLKTASPYTMAMNKEIQPHINEYVGHELPIKLQVFLQKKLDRIKK